MVTVVESDSNNDLASFFITSSVFSAIDKSGKVLVTAAGSPNSVLYSGNSLDNTDYTLHVRCYDVLGNNVDYQINSKTKLGFTITVPINAYVEYIVELI